jgi:hypothetical protein
MSMQITGTNRDRFCRCSPARHRILALAVTKAEIRINDLAHRLNWRSGGVIRREG